MHIVALVPDSAAVTMESVAQLAGVSRSTVSRALRSDPRLKAETCERVRYAAESLGYRPNPFVATLMADLKRKRQPASTSTLAFVTAFGTREGWMRQNPSFLDYFTGAKERAAAQGFALEPFWLREPGMTAERFSRILHTRSIPGVLIPPLPRPMGHLSLDWPRFASLAIGYTLQRPDLSRAVTNFYQSILVVLRKLSRLGYQRIGFATDAQTHQRVQHAWLAGYLVFQESLPKTHRLPAFIQSTESPGTVRKWIDKYRPDAVIGAHNRVLTWIERAGFHVPGDLAFASLNTGREPKDPAGINQQSRLVGATAADLIIGQLHRNERGIPADPMLTLIPGVWTDGPTAAGS